MSRSTPLSRATHLVATLFLSVGSATAQTGVWQPQGPAPETLGQVENIADGEVVGAVHAIAPHPTNANILYIGSVNGGIWRTGNALAASPSWVAQTDQQASLSIGALEFDPTDGTNQTLLAGIGRFSNIGTAGVSAGGQRSGLLRSADGGKTWTPVGAAALAGRNVSGVAARSAILVAAAADSLGGGIWRSTDTGATWTQISGLPGSGLPTGPAFDLAGVRGNNARLYANAGSNGIYVSADTGATWTQVSNTAMNALTPYSNVQIATGFGSVVYVAIANPTLIGTGDTLAGVFRSGNGGTNWVTMDLPTTAEGAAGNFRIHPGKQAEFNLSLAADPAQVNANIVYIGGDRQPGPGDGLIFPNSIGAQNFTGRLFRGDAGQPAGSQFVHLTHSNSRGTAGGGTANNSAPHADSRDMAFDAAGNLIEVDDGGVYRRTQPQNNTGDWFSVNGNLQATEFHSVAWDAVSNIVIGGAQDVGTPEQLLSTSPAWQDVTQGDGGVVAVDDISTPGVSTRFFSAQNLQYDGLTQLGTRQYDFNNDFLGQAAVPLTVLDDGAALQPQFYTPVVVNNVDGTRLVIGAENSVYEFLDGKVREIGIDIVANSSLQGEAIAYGAAGNANMLYVGSGPQVFVRSGAHPASLLTPSGTFPGVATVVDVAIDPDDPQSAYVVDAGNVFQTPDGGANWTNITGNLATLNPGMLRSVGFVRIADQEAVVVGANRGVFWADRLPQATWSIPCSGLPNAPVVDLEFDRDDDILLAGTLGRGAWTCAPARPRAGQYSVKFFCGTGRGNVLGLGNYHTAVNIGSRAARDTEPVPYQRYFSIGLPGEVSRGRTPSRPGATLSAGEAVELDCKDILDEAARICPAELCKGFVHVESLAPLDVVAVYTSGTEDESQVTGLHLERAFSDGFQCPLITLTVPARTVLFTPPHVRGDRDFAGNGPCVRLDVKLEIEDDGTALTAHYQMEAFECSDSFTMPQADHTAAVGKSATLLLSAGPNGRILGYSVTSRLHHTYVDKTTKTPNEDFFPFSADEPVQSLDFIGDTDGDEAGSRTRVLLTFREMDVTLETCSTPSNGG